MNANINMCICACPPPKAANTNPNTATNKGVRPIIKSFTIDDFKVAITFYIRNLRGSEKGEITRLIEITACITNPKPVLLKLCVSIAKI